MSYIIYNLLTIINIGLAWRWGMASQRNMRLKLARVEQDLSQEQLADLVGVTRQTIGMIESGNYNPTLKLCISICKVLSKTLNDIFWEEL
jgi:putative transcriptional regulator